MKNIFLTLIISICAFGCAQKTTTATVTKKDEPKVEEIKASVPKEESGLRGNTSFINTDETETIGKYTWAKVNYIYQITKDLRRNDLYDLTVKKPFVGKDSGGQQTVFVTSMSTLKEADKYTVKMRFAERKNEYEWKPNPASYIDCIFDLKAGTITYNIVGTNWQKFQKNNSIIKTIADKKLSSTKAMSIAAEYIIANYHGAFAN
jgi:hypothetical protein